MRASCRSDSGILKTIIFNDVVITIRSAGFHAPRRAICQDVRPKDKRLIVNEILSDNIIVTIHRKHIVARVIEHIAFHDVVGRVIRLSIVSSKRLSKHQTVSSIPIDWRDNAIVNPAIMNPV